MQKVSYMGDGSTTEFNFNFPYFENTNIIVTKNGVSATGYSIVGIPAGLNADIPYVGGKVVFETAPTTLDCIIISRSLPLQRVVDYQPTAELEPSDLNQDANYLMEIIKDFKDELDDFDDKYSDIVDKESTTVLLERIDAIHNEIVDIDAKIDALGDISTLQDTVSGLVTTTENHTTSITTLDTRTTGMSDYVVASQIPNAQNNYTWYRKYKSGWIEQGGIITGLTNGLESWTSVTINLPVTMSDDKYTITTSDVGIGTNAIVGSRTDTLTTSSFVFKYYNAASVAVVGWMVCGLTE